MDMLNPANADVGLYFVIIATAIATILSGFLIVALIARFGFKVKISFSGFIAATFLSILFFIGAGAIGPNETTFSLMIVQAYSLFLFVGTIILNYILLKLFQPKSMMDLAKSESLKASADLKVHYDVILKELNAINNLKKEQGGNSSVKIKQFLKSGQKGNSNVKS